MKRREILTLVAVTLIAISIAFLKSAPCQSSGWQTPGQYIHGCYSDIPALFGDRALDRGVWPYSRGDLSVEYPVLQGLIMWLLALPVSTHLAYFLLNALFLSLLFIGSALVVRKINSQFTYLAVLAPAVIGSLFINWDLWAIISMLLAIYFFDKGKFTYSGILLAVSISTKFFPIFLVVPIFLILWRKNEVKVFFRYLAITVAMWLLINLPVALTNFMGWSLFYRLNLDRKADWGSLWYSLSALGVNLPNLNYISILLVLASLTALVIYFLELEKVPTLATSAFLTLAPVMIFSKVYSPQYVLWLTPLGVIALHNKKFLPAFWSWQGAELLYHLAIWQHLATVTGAHFGLPLGGYALISLARIAFTIYFCGAIVRQGLAMRRGKSTSSLREFLFESSSAYP